MKFRQSIIRFTTAGLVTLLLSLGAFAASAQAVQVIINPNGYGATSLDSSNQGRWGIDGPPSYYGVKNLDLTPGSHQIFVGSRADGGAFGVIPFFVDAIGNVTVSNESAMGTQGTLLFNTAAVYIDPTAYSGNYAIAPYVGVFTGPVRVNLIKGLHFQLKFDYQPLNGSLATFLLDSTGNLSTDWPESFNINGNILTFKTSEVYTDPGAYAGLYSLPYPSGLKQSAGPQTLPHVPGITYRLRVGQTDFSYTVAEDGRVTSNDPASLIATGNTLTFVTVPLTIDPSRYSLHYIPDRITSYAPVVGELNTDVVCDASYAIRLSGPTWQTIQVDCNGTVSVSNEESASGGQNVVIYKNTDITIDPGLYTGSWRMANVSSSGGNPLTLTLIPSVSYSGYIGQGIYDPGNGFNSSFAFDVDANGIVTVANDGAMSASGSAITFNNATIILDPLAYPGEYFLQSASDHHVGVSALSVVPNISYMLRLEGVVNNALFTVAEPCAVNPPQVTVEGQLFNINCGSLDADGDGVPDEEDNCPETANPDQLDLDNDSYGDDCDDDLDGDGVSNMVDNCVDVANADQSDLDGDSRGDVCDNDNDGDAIPDEDDNCPELSNADQADTDLDGAGDTCDQDDDDDLIDDEYDNCPLSANTDQADYDNDGEGDICDGDRDNDGVANETDICDLTPVGVMIDEKGCSGSQFIEKSCRWEDFGQHGKYVSCVAHAANDAQDKGLIEQKEKARYIKDAAKNK